MPAPPPVPAPPAQQNPFGSSGSSGATVYPFTPSRNGYPPFQFQPTLDGNVYTAITTWNAAAQRWYLNLYALDGTLVVAIPVIGSPAALPLQSLNWAFGTVTATIENPHNIPLGAQAKLTVAGCAPAAFNGTFIVSATGPTSFSYKVPANPGQASRLGIAAFNVNLVAGYFTTSLLVFRESANQFEVSP